VDVIRDDEGKYSDLEGFSRRMEAEAARRAEERKQHQQR